MIRRAPIGAVAIVAVACSSPALPALAAAGPAPTSSATGTRVDPCASADLEAMWGRTRKAVAEARASAAKAAPLVREVTLPSIERLVEDAEQRRGSITVADRDLAFVRRNLQDACRFAGDVVAGRDPYRAATGLVIKAYRADGDGALVPYALYVPTAYAQPRNPRTGSEPPATGSVEQSSTSPNAKPGKPGWPLIVALHGAFSDYRHNLRRAFGLDNRKGENDAEASRNELPFPDVPALVVSPTGRGELMGYDGLGGEDVMRVIADVRRAYDVDPDRVSLTGLSMGGGGTWQIGLRHPEMFAAIAPVCGVTDVRKWIAPNDRAFYDLEALEAQSPLALAANAAHMQVFIFHGDADPTVPVGDSRRMVERYRALGWLGKNVRYTEYKGVDHNAWGPAYKDAALLRTLAAVKRDPAAPKAPAAPPPPGEAVPGLFGKSIPREHPHLYVYGTNGPPEAVAAARALATRLAEWGPMVSAKFVVKADREVTAGDRARFDLVLVGAAPLNALADQVAIPELASFRAALGDQAFRAVAADPRAPHGFALVLGALTPRGFERLRRFARPNRDAWAPEPNKPFLLVTD